LRCLLGRFPDYWAAIKALSAQQHAFMDLADEYAAARAAREHWSGSIRPDAPRQADEYRQIVAELENEALLALQRFQADQEGRR